MFDPKTTWLIYAGLLLATTGCGDPGAAGSAPSGSGDTSETEGGVTSDAGDAESSDGESTGVSCDAECGPNGTCVDGGCECDAGYQGESCETCDEGFVQEGNRCIMAEGDGTGPQCPQPPQAAIDPGWPETFVGLEGCDDGGAGTREQPYCSLQLAVDAHDAPAVVTILEGTYRLGPDDKARVVKPGTADAYFTIRADEGARPVFYGSIAIEGGAWESVSDGVWRTLVDGFTNDPKGLWLADGTRVLHQTFFDDARRHADVADLTEPNRWTKADANGARCDTDNAGCFIYLRPEVGLDPNSADFEASQTNVVSAIGSDYLVVRGLTTRFTQNTGVFAEGADFTLLEDNDFGHNANGNDNAYSAFVQYADGTMMYGNRAFDSRYWGGFANSRGLTVMSGGNEADIWICNNEVYDVPGPAIGTKGGVSKAHVVGNHVYDVSLAVEIPNDRCHWNGCDVEAWPGGDWEVRENIFERCNTGIDMQTFDPESDYAGNRIFNNLFLDTGYGIALDLGNRPELIRNNVFIGGDAGLLHNVLVDDGDGWPDRLLANGLDSDWNLFFDTAAVMQHPNSSGASYFPLTLREYQEQYGGDPNSLSMDPLFDDAGLPTADSPLLGAGDASVYEGAASVNIGPWPFYQP